MDERAMTPAELAWLDDQICRYKAALAELRRMLKDTNPRLLAVTEKAYLHRIADLQRERAQAQLDGL